MKTIRFLIAVLVALTATGELAFAAPNLTPYKPSGWSDKIVVSRTTGNNTDSTSLTPSDTLYVDWAVINNGTTATAATFNTELYVDGVLKTTFNTPAPLNVSSYASFSDYSIGTLSAGTHTILLKTDSTNVIAETNETASDNQFTKTITVTAPTPNLTPYEPSGWSDKIVVSRTTGNHTDSSSLTTADTLYIDWAVINDGAAATAATFNTELYVDGVLKTTFNTPPPLNVSSYASFSDYSIGTLSAGTHTILLKTDSTNVIAESNESASNNQFTKTITVAAPPSPNLTPHQPSGWSDKIVVSRAAGNNTDSTSLTTADSLYVDWAVINSGTGATAATFYTQLFVDGIFRDAWNTPSPLNAGSPASIVDYSIGSLSAGTHTVKIITDSSGVISESNEGDNEYTKTIIVNIGNLPAPALSSPTNGSSGQSTTPSFTWSSVPGATSYRILVATNAADLPTDPMASTGGPSVVINGTPATNSFTPATPLNVGTTYYWEVHGRSSSQFGTWSSVNTFITNANPDIHISPATLRFSQSGAALANGAAVAQRQTSLNTAVVGADALLAPSITTLGSQQS